MAVCAKVAVPRRGLHDARDYILEALPQAAEHGGVWLELARTGRLQAIRAVADHRIERVAKKRIGQSRS
jgi:hypothetical protein